MGTRDSTARRIQPGHEHIVEELAGLPESDRYAIVEAADEEARRRARALTSTEMIDSSADLGHVLPQALELPRDDRTRLAVLLLESIDASEQDGDVEDAWLDEITRRLDEHEKGTARTIPAEVVFAEARDRLKRARG